MNLHNYKKASDHDVISWLEQSIPELSKYQKQKIRESEMVRLSPFQFMQRRKKVNSFWLRLTIIFMPIVWLMLLISLPFNFLFTGSWGYEYETLKWYDKWRFNIGL